MHLVETSPVLINQQKIKLKGAAREMHWHAAFEDVPEMPLIVVANELFDALPMQQLQLTEDGWRERVVGLKDGELTIGLGGKTSPPAWARDAEPALEKALNDPSELVQRNARRSLGQIREESL